MTYYTDIYEQAADNYGLITSENAHEMGIPVVELGKLHKRGRLNRVGHGVYRIIHYIPTPLDVFADAVALVGRDAYLFGESVIAMHGLAPTNPSSIKVATPHKIRKTLPRHLIVITRQEDEQVTKYEGIPSQSVADAIRSCRTTMMVERLLTAIREVQRQGFIKKDEAARLSKEIRSAKKYTKQQAEPRQGTTAQLQESVRCAHTDGQRNNRPTPA